MTEKSETLNRESVEQTHQSLRHEAALKALQRLREIGEQLPAVDAAAIVSEGRNLPRQETS